MKLLGLVSVAFSLCLANAYAASVPRTAARRADTPTTTSEGNGIATPTPVDSGIASNCNKFTLVTNGEGVGFILADYNISLDDFYAWNPSLGGNPNILQPDYYYCVGIIGLEPTSTTSPTGAKTPVPTMPGMVDGCDSFYLTTGFDTCDIVAYKAHITVDQFIEWNESTAAWQCPLWAAYWYCTGVGNSSSSS